MQSRDILLAVSRDQEVPPDRILSRSRRKECVHARDVFALALREQGWTVTRIGEYLDRAPSAVSRMLARSIITEGRMEWTRQTRAR